jgi:ABC-2 type transport system permease protein
MRKYLETVKVFFKTQLAYRFDVLTNTLFTVAKILLAYVLWGAIFKERDTVSGFTFSTMLTYYIVNSFIIQLDQSTGIGWQIADEIKNGRFSKYIVRPMNIFGYFTAQSAGVSGFLLSFNLIAAIIWVLILKVDFTIAASLPNIAAAILLTLLGLLFMVQLNYFIGILAFKFLDTSIFMMIKDNIIEFVRGSLIPLTLLPDGILSGMMLFPFYYISYLPTMLLLGRNENEAVPGILILIAWNAGFWLINSLTFKRLKSKYDGGGI